MKILPFTFQNISWDTKAEDIIHVFYDMTGIVLEEGEDAYRHMFSSTGNQIIVIAGYSVESIAVSASTSQKTLDSIRILFLLEEIEALSASSENEEAGYYQQDLSRTQQLYALLNEKYGPGSTFIHFADPANSPLYYVNSDMTDEFGDWFLSSALENRISYLITDWNNITLFTILHTPIQSLISSLEYSKTPPDCSTAIDLYKSSPTERPLSPHQNVSLGISFSLRIFRAVSSINAVPPLSTPLACLLFFFSGCHIEGMAPHQWSLPLSLVL